MALTLSAAFLREASRADSRPTILVNIGDLTGGKFVMASRRVLGYTNNVLKVPGRSSGLDPLTCKQTLNTMTIDFADDTLLRGLISANKLIGKTCTLTLGFDTGDDAEFLETDYAGYSAGVIDTWEAEPGILRIVLRDARSVFFRRDGAPIKIPSFLDVVYPGQDPVFLYDGPASSCLKQLLISANLAATHYTAGSYAPAASVLSGHLQVIRTFYRRLVTPTEVQVLLDQIGAVLRGYNLVLEDGLLAWKEFNATAVATDRFLEADMVPGSIECRQDSKVISSFSCQTAWDGTGFRFTFRDKNSSGESDWSYTGGTTKPADFAIQDEWFTETASVYGGALVDAGATSFKILTGRFAGAQDASGKTPGAPNPNVVNATYPGYVFLRGVQLGTQPANPGEIIKYTTITKVDSNDTYELGGLTRGMFGTSDIQHATTLDGPGPLVADVTAVIRCGTEVIKRFREGASSLEFDTPLHKYAVQLADVVYVETDVFIRYGLDGLVAGNVVPFEVVQKEVNLEKGIISWKLVEIRTASHTPTWGGGGRFPGGLDLDPFPGLGGSEAGGLRTHGTHVFNTGESRLGGLRLGFVGGEMPPTSGDLTHTIPYQRATTRAGITVLPGTSRTYTASKDTYVDLEPAPGIGRSRWRYTEVAPQAEAPGLTAGDLRAFRVRTNGAAITSVGDLREMALVESPNIQAKAVSNEKIGDDTITHEKINRSAGIRLEQLEESLRQTIGGLRELVFGVGEDGIADFDGTSTVLGLVPSGSTYTLTTDISCSKLIIRAGVTIITNGFRVFADTVIPYGSAVIHCDGGDGGDATSRTAGGSKGDPLGGLAASTLGAGSSGSPGGVGGTAPNGNGTAASTAGTVSLGYGGAGGAGAAGQSPVGTGGAGGSSGPLTVARARIRNLFSLHGLLNGVTRIEGGSGGGGGGGGGADAGTAGSMGGGGGSGASVVLICCRVLDLVTGAWTGRVSANGGAGGDGLAGGLWQGGGGGGGGGGLVAILAGSVLGTLTYSPLTRGGAAVSGAVVTAHGGGGGSGFGGSATVGTNGYVVLVDVSRPFVSIPERVAATSSYDWATDIAAWAEDEENASFAAVQETRSDKP